MAEATATIRIVGKDEASSEIKKVQSAISEIEKSSKSLQGKSPLADLLGGSRLGQLATTAGAIAATAAAVGYVGKQSIQAASELQSLEQRASVIYGDSFPRVKEEADKLGESLHRSGSDILGFETNITTLAQSMKIPQAAAEEMGDKMASLAVDFSKFYGNISDEEALDAIRGGLVGMTRQLTALGVTMRDDQLQAYALSRGWKGQVSDMSDVQQMYLRYNYLLDNTTKQQEGAAKAAGSMNDRWKETKGRVHDAFEELGKPALPTAAFGLEVFNNFLKGTSFILSTLGGQIKGAMQDFTNLGVKLAQIAGFEGVGVKPLETKMNLLGGKDAVDLSEADLKKMTAAANDSAKGAKKGDEEWRKFMGSLGGSSKAGKDTTDDLKKIEDGLNDLVDGYWSARGEIDRALGTLENEHKDKMTGIREEVEKTMASIQDLDRSFARSLDGIDRSEADALSKSTGKIDELQKKVDELARKKESMQQRGLGVEMDLTDDLEKATQELAKEKAALEFITKKSSSTVKDLAGTRGGMTDSQREFSDLEGRRKEETDDHTRKINDLNTELQKINDKRTAEEAAYSSTRTELQETKTAMVDFHDTYISNLTDINKVTEDELKKLKAKLDDLKTTIGNVDALMKSRPDLTGGTTVTSQAKARAAGGVVTESMTLVGERGPELVSLPYGSKVHTASESRSMSGSVSIQIGEIHVHNEADENRFIENLARQIQLRSLNAA